MKKLVLSLALLFGAMTLFNTQMTAQGGDEVIIGPGISVDKDVHDYGTLEFGSDGTCQFTVTNNGTEPLIISKCKGSCGCTVPTCDKTPILPGESSVITVKYDTKRVGPINKSVTITSNAVNSPTKVVRIKGSVNSANTDASPIKDNSGAPTN